LQNLNDSEPESIQILGPHHVLHIFLAQLALFLKQKLDQMSVRLREGEGFFQPWAKIGKLEEVAEAVLVCQAFFLLLHDDVFQAEVAVVETSLVALVEPNTDLEDELGEELDEVFRYLYINIDIQLSDGPVDVSACLPIFGDLEDAIIFQWNNIIGMNGMLIGCRTYPPIQRLLKSFDTHVPLEDETSLQNVTFRHE
jgi:hypothetical protein